MEQEIKALYIVVNAGFANDIIEIARDAGADGATILNARGESILHGQIMGITIDSEKEIVLTLVDKKTADRILEAVKEKAGVETPAHSICFVIPVDKTLGLRRFLKQEEN